MMSTTEWKAARQQRRDAFLAKEAAEEKAWDERFAKHAKPSTAPAPTPGPLAAPAALRTGCDFAHLNSAAGAFILSPNRQPIAATTMQVSDFSHLNGVPAETPAEAGARAILDAAARRDTATGTGEPDLPADPRAAAIILAGRKRDNLGRGVE